MNNIAFLLRHAVFPTWHYAALCGTRVDAASRLLGRLAREGVVVRLTRGVWAQPEHPRFTPFAAVPLLVGHRKCMLLRHQTKIQKFHMSLATLEVSTCLEGFPGPHNLMSANSVAMTLHSPLSSFPMQTTLTWTLVLFHPNYRYAVHIHTRAVFLLFNMYPICLSLFNSSGGDDVLPIMTLYQLPHGQYGNSDHVSRHCFIYQ